jgi:hypothetical protein
MPVVPKGASVWASHAPSAYRLWAREYSLRTPGLRVLVSFCDVGEEFCEEIARRPVSRVLSRPLRAGDDHSSGTPVTGRLARPTRMAGRKRPRPCGRPSLLGLAPGGVYPAAPVAGGAVRSYRTISPLPALALRPQRRRCVSVALSLGSPPPDVIRHRVSVEPGLSSLRERRAVIRPSGARTIAGPGRQMSIQ